MTQRPDIPSRFLRFVTVGALSSLSYVIIVAVAVEFLALKPTSASVFAYLVALPLSYFGNRKFTYRSRNAKKTELPRFVAVHSANIAVASAAMWCVVEYFGLTYWIGSALAVMLVPVSTFVMLELWVFAQQEL